jgi:hypothetical protein
MPEMLQQNMVGKLKNIKNPLVRQRYLKYLQLPEDLRQMFLAVETADKIGNAAKKNNLDKEQTQGAAYTTGMILLGELDIVDFVKTLQRQCGLDEELARKLARDINQAIFLPVRESLKELHEVSSWPRENETTNESPAPGPTIEGNIIDLKREE